MAATGSAAGGDVLARVRASCAAVLPPAVEAGAVQISDEGVRALAARVRAWAGQGGDDGASATAAAGGEGEVAAADEVDAETVAAASRLLLGATGGEDAESAVGVVPLPLRFDGVEEEADALGVLALLNIGSGFRRELHQRDHPSQRGGGASATAKTESRGAYETMRFGVMGMALNYDGSGSTLGTECMAAVGVTDVERLFQCPKQVDIVVMPGVTRSADGPLAPLVDHLRWLLSDTSQVLRARQLRGLGQFVMDEAEKRPRSAAALVEALVKAFPGFDDSYLEVAAGKKAAHPDDAAGGAEEQGSVVVPRVEIHKKAQLFVADLYRVLRTKDARFDFEDIGNLTIFADNVLPALFRHSGALVLSDALATRIDEGESLRAGSRDEVQLRAAAIIAGDALAKELGVDPHALDAFLWRLGKAPKFRKLERHATSSRMY